MLIAGILKDVKCEMDLGDWCRYQVRAEKKSLRAKQRIALVDDERCPELDRGPGDSGGRVNNTRQNVIALEG